MVSFLSAVEAKISASFCAGPWLTGSGCDPAKQDGVARAALRQQIPVHASCQASRRRYGTVEQEVMVITHQRHSPGAY